MKFDQAQAAVAQGRSPEDVAREFVAALTPEQRLWCLDGDAPTWAGLSFLQQDDGYHQATFTAARIPDLGLPGISFSDGPRGCVVGNGTAFPVTMARGATWDPALEETVGEAIGRELRAAGANLTGAVCINVLRHPAWGRAQETYGEDPHHVGEMGAALTRGLQRHVMACVKHFACNSMENARFKVDIEVDEVALHEVYLPHFRRVVDAGVASVMTAYNSVNGEWCGESPTLIQSILREEWGFDGFVISDWIFGLRDAAMSVRAGLDIEMPYRMVRMRDLPKALDSGDVAWADVDRCVERVVATLLRFDEVLSRPAPPVTVLGSAEHRDLARRVAVAGTVLLRNEDVSGKPALPLDPTSSVSVFGHLASRVNLGDGGSSDVWDLEARPVLAGLVARYPELRDGSALGPQEAAELARTTGAAVVVVGFTYADEGEFIGETDPALHALFPPGDEEDVVTRFVEEIRALPETIKPERLEERPVGFSTGGDRRSLRLPEQQVELIKAVAAVNARTIVVIQAGSAVVVDEWVDEVAAVVYGWYAGCEAGAALADVLSGTVEPAGRLPFSIPRREEDLPDFDPDARRFVYDRWHGWWHLERQEIAPAYPFGFGLTYTSFVLGATSASVTDGAIRVDAVVRNEGERSCSDVVQVYAQLPDPEAPARLVGFARVQVPARGASEVTVTVPLNELSSRDDTTHSWVAAAGRHVLTVGRFSGDPDSISHELVLADS